MKHCFRTTRCTIVAILVASLMQLSVEAHTPTEAMTEAANQFLAALDANQREKVQFDFDDSERKNWHFIPMERAGLALTEMQPHQHHLAMALLSSALSHQGYSKAMNIMALEQILHEMENNSPRRDPLDYHFYIFGSPSNSQTWGWRAEGHHLSVSLTLVDGKHVAVTPSFWGANPGKVKQGPQKGLQALRVEEELARKLLHSLDDQQRDAAVLDIETPDDVINGPGREAATLKPLGLVASELNKKQLRMLVGLVREYVFNYRREFARADMKKIRQAGVEKVYFAWAGGDQPGQPHYYRVQGPTFVMEYDNTQNNANHIHVVWRDLENDFGEDLLKQHYDESHN